ncbi:RagB/SusD family nutrient uptake outer membrane protein [Rudanella paleaurantiibacter]|uniref:RagB/SusD family nutrient uptake outer membrane protein n=1 Tax=Rudanella paleaurantiibacter TaxID=2614655 RepID=A0A7J5U037_9BACT|nr:RagB/SusD family nutrient uptake outer membrane protein [Rudanella paleaurantiibacter]KAB7731108.1 RagB/SusD family nutrient uptake outer membrane protein [Rudanella paleaurantiibacter]
MKINHILYSSLLVLGLSACSLEETPPSALAPVNFYTSAGDAVAAVNAVYDVANQIGDQSRNFIIMGDIPSDDMNLLLNNADRIQIWSFQTIPTNGVVSQSWQILYQGVNRANTAIERIPGIQMDENLKKRLIGEAKFMRAFYYFYLVRWWGGVPLMLTETKSLADGRDVKRATADEVYAQIIKDLTDAETALPDRFTGADLGRATAGSAKGMLAKVYLQRKDFTNARAKSKEVIDNAAKYGYGLFDRYADAFAISNKNGRESVFEIQFVGQGTGQGSGMVTYFAPENSPVTGRGFGSFFPTTEFYNSFDPTDKRRELFINSYVDGGGRTVNTFQHFNKYQDPSARAFGDANNNFPIIRYADVLLMFAEAENELNGPTALALNAANPIRRRAFGFGLNATSPVDFTAALGKEGFRQRIYDERRWEFNAEGQRWFDLVRTGRLVSVLKAKGKENVQEKHNLFPIPQREIDLNPNLTQNPNY